MPARCNKFAHLLPKSALHWQPIALAFEICCVSLDGANFSWHMQVYLNLWLHITIQTITIVTVNHINYFNINHISITPQFKHSWWWLIWYLSNCWKKGRPGIVARSIYSYNYTYLIHLSYSTPYISTISQGSGGVWLVQLGVEIHTQMCGGLNQSPDLHTADGSALSPYCYPGNPKNTHLYLLLTEGLYKLI